MCNIVPVIFREDVHVLQPGADVSQESIGHEDRATFMHMLVKPLHVLGNLLGRLWDGICSVPLKLRKVIVRSPGETVPRMSNNPLKLQNPVANDVYRMEDNPVVFGGYVDDQFRIPAMENLNDGSLVCFTERRYNPIAFNDFKCQDIQMKTMDSNGNWGKAETLVRSADVHCGSTKGTFLDRMVHWLRHKHCLQNPVTVYDKEKGTLHLFYQHIVNQWPGNKLLGLKVMHMEKQVNGAWTEPKEITDAFKSNPEAEDETVVIGPGRAICIPDGEYKGRIVIPMHTRKIQGQPGSSDYPQPGASGKKVVETGSIKVAYSDDQGKTWQVSNRVETGKVGTCFTEKQIASQGERLYIFTRLGGKDEYRGTGLLYSDDGGQNWQPGLNDQGPRNEKGENTAITGRFVTPTQPGLSSDGKYLYYTTTVYHSANKGITNRRQLWIHRIDPAAAKDGQLIVDSVQPITLYGCSNVVTCVVGKNRLGILWEENRVSAPIPRIRNMRYTEVDTRDFRSIKEWKQEGFDYYMPPNESNDLFNTEVRD